MKDLEEITSTGIVKKDSFYCDIVAQLKLKNRVPPELSLSYETLESDVDRLVKIEKEIEDEISRNGTPILRAYSAVRGFVLTTILGRKRYSMEELFGMQLGNISRINKELSGITAKARTELDQITKYADRISLEHIERLRFRQEAEAVMSNDACRYKELQECMRSQDGTEYYLSERDANIVRRAILEKKHQYDLCNDAVVDLDKEKGFLGIIEELARVSIHTCEKMQEKTKRLSRHVTHTKRIYEEMKRQQIVASNLYRAVDALSRYTHEVHRILGAGIEGMNEAVSRAMPPTTLYDASSANLSPLLEGIIERNNEENVRLDEDVEERTTKIYKE